MKLIFTLSVYIVDMITNKNILILIALWILSVIPSKADWMKIENIQPPFDKGYYLDIMFLPANPKLGWACGKDGLIIRTIDGGMTWYGTALDGQWQLESICFADPRIGYCSGNNKIFKSIDGGASWTDLYQHLPPDVSLWGNFFLNANIGMVIGGGCGTDQIFYRTEDGGNNWSNFQMNYPDAGLTDVMLYSPDGLGYASGSGAIFKTTDGGRSWRFFSKSGSSDWQEEITNINRSICVPYSVGCSGGLSSGGMRYTTNGGATWNDTNLHASMFGSFLIDEQRAWGCGSKRNVVYTSNGGATWHQRNCGISAVADLDDIWFINDTLGFVAGDGIYITHKYIPETPVITSSGSHILCRGDTLTLSVTKDFKYYSWSTGATSKSIKITESGDYWLIVNSVECDSAQSGVYHVDVYDRPKPSIKSIDSSFCEGDSTKIFLTKSFKSVKWSTGETTDTIIVKKGGKYSVAVSDSTTCSASVYLNVRMIPRPNPVIDSTGKLTFCIGDSVILNTVEGNYRYDWYDLGNSEFHKTGSNKIVIKAPGKYFVVISGSDICSAISDTVPINVLNEFNNLLITGNAYNDRLEFDSVSLKQLDCKYITLHNIGNKPFAISDIYLKYNTSFSIPQSQFSFTLMPGEKRDVKVCFMPHDMKMKEDSLVIEDICWSHRVYVRGTSKDLRLNAVSECGDSISANIIKTSKSYFIFQHPYPNPSDRIINVPYSFVAASADDFNLDIKVFNSVGIDQKISASRIANVSESDGQVNISGSYRINLTDADQGVYFVKISSEGKQLIYSVYIIR